MRALNGRERVRTAHASLGLAESPQNGIAPLLARVQFDPMHKPNLAGARADRWTRIDAYLEALARRGTARRRRLIAARTEPETPRLMLSTVPFVATMLVLAVLIVLFAIVAWPGSQPQFHSKPAPRELGTAQRGWYQQAQREFR